MCLLGLFKKITYNKSELKVSWCSFVISLFIILIYPTVTFSRLFSKYSTFVKCVILSGPLNDSCKEIVNYRRLYFIKLICDDFNKILIFKLINMLVLFPIFQCFWNQGKVIHGCGEKILKIGEGMKKKKKIRINSCNETIFVRYILNSGWCWPHSPNVLGKGHCQVWYSKICLPKYIFKKYD